MHQLAIPPCSGLFFVHPPRGQWRVQMKRGLGAAAAQLMTFLM